VKNEIVAYPSADCATLEGRGTCRNLSNHNANNLIGSLNGNCHGLVRIDVNLCSVVGRLESTDTTMVS